MMTLAVLTHHVDNAPIARTIEVLKSNGSFCADIVDYFRGKNRNNSHHHTSQCNDC